MGCFVRLGCFLPLVGQVRRRTVNAGELCARAVTETIHCSVFSAGFIVTVAHDFVATIAL